MQATTDFHDGINKGVAPVTYGQGERPPRGNYAKARADYTCEQDWAEITPEQHALYARLYERQSKLLPDLACHEFIQAVDQLGDATHVPRFDAVTERLYKKTKWEIVAVPGLIPEEAFFALLAQRKFPVTEWLRNPDEFDYVVEPDVFHDMFGHVPLLFNPVFADYMQAYGQGGLKAAKLGSCEQLARLYWYTVEFGLINSPQGVRVYGAGIMSSSGEIVHSVRDTKPHRVGFDLERIMRSQYKIDTYQETYFVINNFEQLFEATAPDFTPLYAKLKAQPEYTAGQVLPTDKHFPPG